MATAGRFYSAAADLKRHTEAHGAGCGDAHWADQQPRQLAYAEMAATLADAARCLTTYGQIPEAVSDRLAALLPCWTGARALDQRAPI